MGVQAKIPIAENENIKIYIDGEIMHRDEAKISVFDSLVQGGDGVWEGLRLYEGKIFKLDAHLSRLRDSAKAMFFTDIPEDKVIKQAIAKVLTENDMWTDVHLRLTLSRGMKVTSGMSPHWNQYGSTLIIIPEFKPPVFGETKLRLITSSIRRNSPSCLDSKIHHNNLINNILAKIQANEAGVDEAVMLDLDGFVAETNACNIFFIKEKVIYTPHPHACLPGITRKTVIDLAKGHGIEIYEKNISIAEMYSCDECFVTGTMGELTSVVEIDGRKIEGSSITQTLRNHFQELTKKEGIKVV